MLLTMPHGHHSNLCHKSREQQQRYKASLREEREGWVIRVMAWWEKEVRAFIHTGPLVSSPALKSLPAYSTL